MTGTRCAAALSALLVALATGCGNRSRDPANHAVPATVASGSAAGRVVGFVGSQPLTLGEVEAPVAHEIYAARTVAIRDLLTRKLVKAEAERRKLSVEELLRVEIDGKVATPTEAELRAFFTKAQTEGRIPRDQEFDRVKDAFLGTRMKALHSDREYAFVKELSDKAQVRIDLDGLGRPAPPPNRPGPTAGPAGARLVLVEYTDYKSPFCKQANATLEALMKEYPNALQIVFRHKPAPNDEASFRAAEAALCASDQQQYWKYRQALFARQNDFSMEALVENAKASGLNEGAFRACLTSRKHQASIEQDVREARSGGYEGSPVYSLNGTRLSGAHEFSVFKELIDTELTWVRRPSPERS